VAAAQDPDDLAAWLRLAHTPGVGRAAARKLLACWGDARAVLAQPEAVLAPLVGADKARALLQPPANTLTTAQQTLQWLDATPPGRVRRGILTLGDAGYPKALLTLADPPLVLYALGAAVFQENSTQSLVEPALAAADLDALPIRPDGCLAVVGSRNPTPQGLENARHFAHHLALGGWTVVSGLALGIDGAAHAGALQAASTRPNAALTVAVVGTGLDRVYPKAHHALAHQIAEHGLILSEYPLGTPPLTAHFPQRNRIIAALARGCLVVEAAVKSGSLITARLSAELGKEVFAVPGSIHAPQARGCHALIQQGAKLVTCAQDILDECPLATGSGPLKAAPDAPFFEATNPDNSSASSQNEDESQVLSALGHDPTHLEALQARTGRSAADLQAVLMNLELDGRVVRRPGGLFQRQVLQT